MQLPETDLSFPEKPQFAYIYIHTFEEPEKSARLGADGLLRKHIYIYIRKSSFLESQKQPQQQLQKEPKKSLKTAVF